MARDKMDKGASFMEKKSFIRSGEGSIASYSWTDLITKFGYADFYGMAVKDNNEYLAVTAVLPSQENYTRDEPGTTDYTELATFKTAEWRQPLTLKTDIFCSFRWAVHRSYTGDGTFHIKVTVYKNETELTNDTTAGFITGGDTNRRDVLKLTLDAEERIKIGDIIKIKFEVSVSYENDRAAILHNPLDTSETLNLGGGDQTCEDSQLLIKLPFDIEL